MTKQNAIHLVIRISDRVGGVKDIITEHRTVLQEKGGVWFGKIGKPLSDANVRRFNKRIEAGFPSYLYLVQRIDREFAVYRGTITKVVNYYREEFLQEMPSYYTRKFVLTDINCWVHVVDIIEQDNAVLSELKCLESINTVRSTLESSASSFFVVEAFH